MPSKNPIHIVGAGLAGSECALQLANFGHSVVLYEMRDKELSPAHKTPYCAEIVCSNSFGSTGDKSGTGQLKWEAALLGSKILEAAKLWQVPAGQALAIDRDQFAKTIHEWVSKHPLIELRQETISSLDQIPRPAIIATGPLTHDLLAKSLKEHFGHDFLYFFDAIAPIIDADSIDKNITWRADRYDKGDADYLNCPLTKEEYFRFIEEVKNRKKN